MVEKIIEKLTPSWADDPTRLRILLELDRIGSALETMITLMDDHEEPPTDIDMGHPYDDRVKCRESGCESWARKGHANCKEHAAKELEEERTQ